MLYIKPGMAINRYRVLKLISEGGMGSVWLVEDSKTGIKAVMKTPKIKGDPKIDNINIEKLIFEANILKNLKHNNIVKFIDSFYIGKLPLLTIEYIEGDVLEKISQFKPMEEEEAKKYIIQLLEAIEYIHSLNIIHRDIRPKNIILSNENIKLIDFGTAKYFYEQVKFPEAIIAPGGYTPPEQYRYGASPQGDIWSAGGTLFYILTGQHPIIAMDNYPYNPILSNPKKYNPKISNNVAEVIMKAMQKDPAKRFSTAREMILSLKEEREEEIKVPMLLIWGEPILLEVPRIILGRDRSYDNIPYDVSRKKKVNIIKERDRMFIKIPDPKRFISSIHLEIFEKNGKWFIKDLGSLNKTALFLKDRWIVIWRGYKIESSEYSIEDGQMISLAYDDNLGPYFIITFKEKNIMSEGVLKK
jgi:serine/threonine protein kinase